MLRKVHIVLWGSAALLGLFSDVAASQTPLSQVPAKSPVVVHVRGHERTIGRIKKTLEASLGELSGKVTGELDGALSSLLEGRQLKALAPEGPVFIVMTALAEGDEDPEIAIIAKVTNYVQFRDGLLTDAERKKLTANKAGFEDTTLSDKPVFFLNKGAFAVASFHESAIKRFAAKEFVSLDGQLAKPLQAKLLQNDLAVYVDGKQINKQYGDKIAEFRTMMEQMFQQFETMPGLGKQMDLVKKVYGGIFQLIEDSEQFVAGVSFEPDGIRATAHTMVGEKSETNKVFANSKRARLENLGRLSAGMMTYSTAAGGIEILKMMGFSTFGLFSAPVGPAAPSPNDDKENKEFVAAMSELQKLKIDDWLGASDHPQPVLQAIRYAENKKATELTLKVFESMRENALFGGMSLKGKPKIKRRAQKIKSFEFHNIQITWDLEKSLEALPEEIRGQLKEALQKSLGEGMKIWFGTDGKQFLQVSAKDWTTAERVVTTYLNGNDTLSRAAGFKMLGQRLPAKGSFLFVMDAGKMAKAMAENMLSAFRAFPEAPPIADPMLPAGPPSYIGIVAASESRSGTLDTWLPAAGIQAMVNVFKPLFDSFDEQ